ncbi:hypothetical protein CMK14_16100 [Candidatus Poribacteria bacterium]|nr:hypothetical protein [Candidatus Poribacteria bacterium]
MVSIWEIHFHCWGQASGRPSIAAGDFANLTPSKQGKALADDADIIFSVADELNFGGVTIPDQPCVLTRCCKKHA